MANTEHGWIDHVAKATAATVVGGLILYYLLPAAPPPAPPRIEITGDPDKAWERVKDTCDVDLLDDFRKQIGYSNPVYDNLARGRINLINRNDFTSPCYQPPPALPEAVDSEPVVITPDASVVDQPLEPTSNRTPCALLDNTTCLLRADCQISTDASCEDSR